jgi:hypothetical protein
MFFYLRRKDNKFGYLAPDFLMRDFFLTSCQFEKNGHQNESIIAGLLQLYCNYPGRSMRDLKRSISLTT